MTDISADKIGQIVVETIIEGGLVHADEEEPLLLIWSANAQEQIGSAVMESLGLIRRRYE